MIGLADAKSGGLVALLSETLVNVTASTALFANAPTGTIAITLTVRAGTLTINFGSVVAGVRTAQTATAANGHDYPIGSYDLTMGANALSLARGIGAASTGFVTYWGVL